MMVAFNLANYKAVCFPIPAFAPVIMHTFFFKFGLKLHYFPLLFFFIL